MLIEVTNSLMADDTVRYEVRVKLRGAVVIFDVVSEEAAYDLQAELLTSNGITVITESRFTS